MMHYLLEMLKGSISWLIGKLGYTRLQEGASLSFSQCGEDLIVSHIFKLRGIPNPSYIDIGAHHPFLLSNTALFYHHGSRGVNIEANPQLIEAFKIHRPNDINLNIGIGPSETKLDFFVMEDATLSTFSAREMENMISQGRRVANKISVEMHSIQYILEKHCDNVFPDFLNIDVEGLDYEIVQTIDFEKSYPKVICIEAVEYSSRGNGKRRDDLINFILSKGYTEYANTNLNAIMVKNEFWSN